LRRLRPLQSGLATNHRPLLKGTSPARQQYNYRLSPEVIRLGIVSDLALGFRLLLDPRLSWRPAPSFIAGYCTGGLRLQPTSRSNQALSPSAPPPAKTRFASSPGYLARLTIPFQFTESLVFHRPRLNRHRARARRFCSGYFGKHNFRLSSDVIPSAQPT